MVGALSPPLPLPKLLCQPVNITCEFPSRSGGRGKKLLVRTSHLRLPLHPSHCPNLRRRFFSSPRGFLFFLFLLFFFLFFSPAVPCTWEDVVSRVARWDACLPLIPCIYYCLEVFSFSIPVLSGSGSFAPRPARLRGAEDGVEMAGRVGGVPSPDDLSGGESGRRTGAARQAAGPVSGERAHHRRRQRHRAPPRSRVRRTRRQEGTGGEASPAGGGWSCLGPRERRGGGGCAHLPPPPEPTRARARDLSRPPPDFSAPPANAELVSFTL